MRRVWVVALAVMSCKSGAPAEPARAPECARVLEMGEGDLERAERLLATGRTEVPLDAWGCRVLRALPSDAGLRREQVELRRPDGGTAVTYLRETKPGFSRDRFDREGDGVFETELQEEGDDAGWVSEVRVSRPSDGGWTRSSRQRVGETRVIERSETWVDGGWQLQEEREVPRKPRVIQVPLE